MTVANQDYAVYFGGQTVKFLGQGIFQEKPLAAFSTDPNSNVPDLLIGSYGPSYIIVYRKPPPVDAGIWIKGEGNFWLEEGRAAWPEVEMDSNPDPAKRKRGEVVTLEGADDANAGKKLLALAAAAKPEDIAQYAAIALSGKTAEHSPFKQGGAAAEASPAVLGVFVVDLGLSYEGLISPEFLKGKNKAGATDRTGPDHLEIEYLKTSSGSLTKLVQSERPIKEIDDLRGQVLRQAFIRYQSASCGKIRGANGAVEDMPFANISAECVMFHDASKIQKGAVIANSSGTTCLLQPDHMLVCFFGYPPKEGEKYPAVTSVWAGYAVKKDGGGVTGEVITLGTPQANVRQTLYAANAHLVRDTLQKAGNYSGGQLKP